MTTRPVSLVTRLRAVISALCHGDAGKSQMLYVRPPTMAMAWRPTEGLDEHNSVELNPPLTMVELRNVLTRRVTNLHLPDDNHTLLAESFTTAITIMSSLFAKLYVLNLTAVQSLPAQRPRLARLLQVLTLSQLHPLRILQAPLLRIIRPLQWLLVPFASMATPLALHLTVQRSLAFFFPPRSGATSTSSRRRAHSSHERFVQNLFGSLRLGRDQTSSRVKRVSSSVWTPTSKPSSESKRLFRRSESGVIEKPNTSTVGTSGTMGIIWENQRNSDPKLVSQENTPERDPKITVSNDTLLSSQTSASESGTNEVVLRDEPNKK